MVERTHVKGHLSEVESTLHRKVAQYAHHHGSVYVGATSNPRDAENRHIKRGYLKLITLWRTTSYDKVKKAEKLLIAFAREKGYLDERQIDGGTGLNPEEREYFIYVAV